MIKKIILKLIGRKRIEFLRSKPFWVHGKYRTIINDLNKYAEIIDKNYGSDPDISLLFVRKFGHILDKGLHRDNVEKGHSKNIANELAKNIEIAEQVYPNDDTLVWAKKKLAIYNELQEEGKIKPLQEEKQALELSFEDFQKLVKYRRSNRVFATKTVDNEHIVKLAELVNWASSSCNKQPVKLYATTNPELAKACLKCCKGGTGFGDFIPAFVSFTADMRGYYLPDESYLPAIDVSLGAQNFFLAAETLGLSITVLSWALKDMAEEKQLRAILQIPETTQIIFNVVLGYPMKSYITPIRKSVDDTICITN